MSERREMERDEIIDRTGRTAHYKRIIKKLTTGTDDFRFFFLE